MDKQRLFQDMNRLNSPLEVFVYGEPEGKEQPVNPHWHYYMELIYVLKGAVETTCDSSTYQLNPGDLCVFFPQAVHSIHRKPAADGSKKEVEYYVIMVDLNFLNITNSYRTRFSKTFRVAYEKDPANICFHKKQLRSLGIQSLIEDCYAEMHSRTYGYDVIVCSHIATLLTSLIRILRKDGLNTDEIIQAPDEYDNLIYSITKYIDQHYGEPLKVQDLAEQCNMSYSYFAKLFRETYNQSCKEYIEFIRINKVADLLLFTNLSIDYISQETGFADCSHLIRTFKKWKGVTPHKWRQNRQEFHPL